MGDFIKLKVVPEWDNIENIRNESAEFFHSHKLTDEAIYSLSMIISELIENGIKYGNFMMEENVLTVVINIKNDTITIEVLNPIDDKSFENLAKLDKAIQWIRGFQDPFEAYIERLKKVSKKPLRDRASGIGLVRIAYEGNALLDCVVSENNILNVSAIANLEKEDRK